MAELGEAHQARRACAARRIDAGFEGNLLSRKWNNVGVQDGRNEYSSKLEMGGAFLVADDSL